MLVAHLTSVHPRDDVRIFHKECVSLSKLGYTVTLVVADGFGSESRSGVSIVDVGRTTGRLRRMLITTRRILRRALELDADVYQIHDPELLAICLALKRHGKRVVFDAHEDVPKQILNKHYLPLVLRKTVAWLFAHYERYVCSRIDGVVTATPTIRAKFRDIHDHSQDINNYPIIGELKSTTEKRNSGVEVCYVGNIAAIRGIRELVRALEFTRTDVRLNLVGGFAESHIEDEVRGYPAWVKVHAWGVLGRSGVCDVISRSVAGLVTLHPIPNYIESLPVKMFEYMSAGIPVIASNFPLWEEIVLGYECGVCVNPLDPEQIACGIDALVSDPDKARRLGENGRRAVMERYNWSAEEVKLRAFYDRVLGNV